jgi:hypothetical protein
MHRGVRAGGAVLGAALAALLGSAAPPAHAAIAPSYVVIYSDAGALVGRGVQREFDLYNSSLTIRGTPKDTVTVFADGGSASASDSFILAFSAPQEEALVAGAVYPDAIRLRGPGYAGLDISGNGEGCNTVRGKFEVKDIGTEAHGAVDRLWVVFEQHCEGRPEAIWGELRLNEPGTPAPFAAAQTLRWPETDVGAPTTLAPVVVDALGADTDVRRVQLAGENPGAFVVGRDDCTGRSLNAGERCQVSVRFTPQRPGTAEATLTIAASDGTTHVVTLQGFAHGGDTFMHLHSDPDDPILEGGDRVLDLSGANIRITESDRKHVRLQLNLRDGTPSPWTAVFSPGTGRAFLAGTTYEDAQRYPFNGDSPGLAVSGEARGCNTLEGAFTVRWVQFAPDGTIDSFAADVVQHCDGAAGALRGTFSYRAGDDVDPAPWMVEHTSYVGQPQLIAWRPMPAARGAMVTLWGASLADATSVTFNGVPAQFTVDSDVRITTVVPAGASTGRVVITTPRGSATVNADFGVADGPPPPPVIDSLSPSWGSPGTHVTIRGSDLAGVDTLTLGGVPATFTIVSPHTIVATVPAGAPTAHFLLTASGGEALSPNLFTTMPVVTSFAPASGAPGTTVTIRGSNLDDVTDVTIGGVHAPFIVSSGTAVSATVPAGAATGPIVVANRAGSVATTDSFVVPVPPTPAPPAPAPSLPPDPPAAGGGGGGGLPPDLHVAITADRSTPAVGDTLSYAVEVSTRAGSATGMWLSLQLPAGVELVDSYSDRGPGCNATAAHLECFLDWLSAPIVAHLRVTVRVVSAGSLTLAASVRAEQSDLDATDNTVQLTLTTAAPAVAPPAAAGVEGRSAALRVRIAGRPVVGRTMHAVATPTASSYRWQLCHNGKCATIAGATRSSVHVRRGWIGSRLRVVVRAPALTPVSATSARIRGA